VDYLSLHTGFKFSVPFDMTVIFSTNLRPHELADEAFLRRFGYKIHLGPMDEAQYRAVFQTVCEGADVCFDAEAFAWLIRERHQAEGKPLLACYPRDLIGRVRDLANYLRCDAVADKPSLEHAWTTYFTGVGGQSA